MCSTFYAVGCVFLRNAKMINCLEIPHRSCKVLSDNGLLNISAEGCHYVRVCLFSCGSGDYWRAGSRVLCKNSAATLKALRTRESHDRDMVPVVLKAMFKEHVAKLSAKMLTRSNCRKTQNRCCFEQYNPK